MSARPGRADGHIVAWICDDAHRRQAAGNIPFVEHALPLNGKPAAQRVKSAHGRVSRGW